MAALNYKEKAYIVRALASFEAPGAVVRAIQKDLGVTVSPSQVQAYDPTKAQGARLSQQWRDMFDATRQAFLHGASAVPVAHKVVRLRALDRMAREAEASGNVAQAARLIEQAAKECGGMFGNARAAEGGAAG